MTSFNLQGKFSKGYATFNDKKTFIYKDDKLLSRLIGSEADITDIYSELRNIYRNVNTLYSITSTHTSQISSLQSQTAALRSDMSIAFSQISSLQSATSALGVNINTVSNNLSTTSDILTNQINQNSREIANLKTADTNLSNRIDTVNTTLTNNINKVNDTLSNRIDTVNTTLTDEINDVNTTLSDRIDQLSDSVSSSGDGMTSLESTISTIQSDITTMQSDISDIWSYIYTLESSGSGSGTETGTGDETNTVSLMSLDNDYIGPSISVMGLRRARSIEIFELPRIEEEPIISDDSEELNIENLTNNLNNLIDKTNIILEEITTSRDKINELVYNANDANNNFNECKNSLLETTSKLEELTNTVSSNSNSILTILSEISNIKNSIQSTKDELYSYINGLLINNENPDSGGEETMDETTLEKLNDILTSLNNATTSLSLITTEISALKSNIDAVNNNISIMSNNMYNSLERIESRINTIITNNENNKKITLSSTERIVLVNKGEEAIIHASITGLTNGTCNLYVNGEFNQTLVSITNNVETEIYKEIAEESKEIKIYIEYNDIKSEEITFSIVVRSSEDVSEENFSIASTYTDLNVYSGGKVNYVLDIKGLKTPGFKVFLNGSYYKTVTQISETTNVIIYSENVDHDRIIYIQLQDDDGNYSNIIEYTVTVIDTVYGNNISDDGSSKYIKTLILNCDDLERQINIGDEVEFRASIRGLDYTWCDVYVNDYYIDTIKDIWDSEDVLLYKCSPDTDMEILIQIEDPNKKKSNILRYCVHIIDEDEPPVEEEIEVLPAPSNQCVEYSKLIGGTRSTWTTGNNEVLSDMSKLNINCLTLSVRMVINDYSSNNVSIDEEDLKLCKELMLSMKSQDLLNKIQIILEPCPCINNGEVNERYFKPSDPELFLKNWRVEVIKLVNEFSDYSFYGIYVNTNMDNLCDYIYLWQELYDELKYTRVDTNIMVKTNWWIGNEDDEETGLQGFTTKCTHEYFKIWDIIAISAYFPLGSRQGEGTPSASYEQIRNLIKMGTIEYNQIIENDIKTFAEITGKQIMFGELGIPSLLYGISFPESVNHTDIEDQNTQRNWYQAWHEIFIDYDWFLGWSFYHMADKYNSPYDPTERSAGLYIASIDAINKYKK